MTPQLEILGKRHDSEEYMTSTLKIAALPKVDKAQFISTFIQSQQSHAKAYAEEGLSAFKDNVPDKKENQFGFTATPLLKPRNPRAQVQKHTNSQIPIKLQSPEVPKCEASRAAASSKTAKKRPPKEASDNEEHAARLADRRERKRAKRTAVKPPPAPEPSITSEDPSKKRRPKTRRKDKMDVKSIPALALMHGFSATNVGRKRLTAPPPVVGVFNKGKASNKARVTSKKGGSKNAVQRFSEENFLNHAKKVQSKFSAALAHTVSDSDSESITENVRQKHKVKSNKKTPKAPPDNDSSTLESQDSSSSSSIQDQPQATRTAKSEVWDIERDSFIFPSNVSSAKDLPSGKETKGESVVFDTRGIFWSKDFAQLSERPAADVEAGRLSPAPSDLRRYLRSSSSLAPSQSASQIGLSRRKPTGASTFLASKYFPDKPDDVAPKRGQQISPLGVAEDPRASNVTSSPHKDQPLSYIHQIIAEKRCNAKAPMPTQLDDNAHGLPPIISMPPLFYQPEVDQVHSNSHSQVISAPPYGSFEHHAYLGPDSAFSTQQEFPNTGIEHVYPHEQPYEDQCIVTEHSSFPETIPVSDAEWPSYDARWYDQVGVADRLPPPLVEPFALSDICTDVAHQPGGKWDDEPCSDGPYWDGGSMEDYYHADVPLDIEGFPSHSEMIYSHEGEYLEYGPEYYSDQDKEEEIYEEFLEGEEDLHFGQLDHTSELAASMNDICIEGSEDQDFEMVGEQDFLQGRELLLLSCGDSTRAVGRPRQVGSISFAEADVAKSLRGHWLPQRL
ncbi:hypothetical protein D9758_001124 [Tetrapyrgos nigripes]|uniref:Uncharacterized protein n=1 Tax=Tetrapyrgos nigripes TaxID=182062 RepID=A0A8H5GS97_9AGAR|nr:hypothetical protein D9758_001124 [Tetrapyrgos nigripes]